MGVKVGKESLQRGVWLTERGEWGGGSSSHFRGRFVLLRWTYGGVVFEESCGLQW